MFGQENLATTDPREPELSTSMVGGESPSTEAVPLAATEIADRGVLANIKAEVNEEPISTNNPSPSESPTASQIKAWMAEEGYDNKDLARKLSVSVRAISSLRNGGPYHGADTVNKLAKLMGCEPDEVQGE